MFKLKNILYGLLIATIVCGLTFLIIVVIFPNLYGADSFFYWGNAHVLLVFLAVAAGYFIGSGANRRIIKATKDRYQKITWDHPQKAPYFDTTRILYWVGIWGIIIYAVLYYTIGMGQLIL